VDFVIQWLWYLLAFVAGSVVGRVIATRWIKRGGDQEEASADAPHEVSAQ
jgi:uncharacterized membrane protein ArfB